LQALGLLRQRRCLNDLLKRQGTGQFDLTGKHAFQRVLPGALGQPGERRRDRSAAELGPKRFGSGSAYIAELVMVGCSRCGTHDHAEGFELVGLGAQAPCPGAALCCRRKQYRIECVGEPLNLAAIGRGRVLARYNVDCAIACLGRRSAAA